MIRRMHQKLLLRTMGNTADVYEYCTRCGAIRRWGTVETLEAGASDDRFHYRFYHNSRSRWALAGEPQPYCLAEQAEAAKA